MKVIRHPYFVGCVAVWAMLGLGALVIAQNQPSKPANSSANYRIGPGDVLLVEVAGEPDFKHKIKVSEQGTIRLRHIERDLAVAGLTEHQAADLLNKAFLAVLKEPQVTVFIEEYNALSAVIVGAVREPKRVPLTREMRLYDLIGQAGGLTEKAGEVVQLVHTKHGEGVEMSDLKELFRRPELNRVILDGDMLNVPEVGVIYVTGNVKSGGAFPLKENITLTQALGMAGGLSEDSRRKEIRLWRRTGPNPNERSEQVVNLEDIEKNASKDIVLRAYDTVYVPEATGRKQTRSLVQAFAGGLASALGWGILR